MAEAEENPLDVTSPLPVAALKGYIATLSRYLSRRVRRGQAPDMIQEIMARFLRRQHQPEVQRNPFGYLLGIAKNVLRDAISEEIQGPVVYSSALVDTLAQDTKDPSAEHQGEWLVARDDITAALAKLPENHLLALLLVDADGMSYEEAARISGFTKNTIATYVMHARAAMRSMLPDYWSESSR